MGKTNFDDIELGTAGIEADEINSESAAAGQVLMADGVGGVAWGTGGFVAKREQFNWEDVEATVSWTDLSLPARGVPVTAKAVLLTALLSGGLAGGALSGFYLRPNGADWAAAHESSPGLSMAGEGEVGSVLVVPCGAGEVEYYMRVPVGGMLSVYVTLLGYWL